MEIKPKKEIFTYGCGLIPFELGERHKPKYKNLKKVSFPMKEYITTIVPDDKIPKEFPLTVNEDKTAFYVGLGFVTALILWTIYLLTYFVALVKGY